MVEGSTGGAGLTANGLRRLTEGDPVPLEATLLTSPRPGPDAGRLLAYDEVTVGGLGLTSVSIDRVLVPKDEVNPLRRPAPTPVEHADQHARDAVGRARRSFRVRHARQNVMSWSSAAKSRDSCVHWI